MKLPLILYFINGSMPSKDDIENAQSYEGVAKVVYRNAHHVENTDSLEICDGVTGIAPARYKQRFPDVEEVVKSFKKDKEDLTKRVGDEEAPIVNNSAESQPLQEEKKPVSGGDKGKSEWKAGK